MQPNGECNTHIDESHNHRCYKAPFTAQLPSGRLASLLPPLPLLWPLLLPPPLPLLPPPSSLVVPLPPPLPMPAPRRYRLLPPSQQRGLSKLAHASARPQLPKISHIAVVAVAVALHCCRCCRRCHNSCLYLCRTTVTADMCLVQEEREPKERESNN